MSKRAYLSLAATVVLAGCQTNYQYTRVGAGPELRYAQAQCEIMSNSVQQGVIAWGSPGYVAGAQIGNAIGNAIRVDQFMKNCMIMQGWQRVPVKTSDVQASTYRRPAATPATANSSITSGLKEWASANNACVGGDKRACKRRDIAGAKLKKLGVNPSP